MAHICPFKDKWRAQIYVGGIRDSAVFEEKYEAEAWAKKRETEIKRLRDIANRLNDRAKIILNDSDLHSKDDIIQTSIKIPRVCGVYFLIKECEIVYVGKSINVHNRLGSHLCDKDFDKINIIECGLTQLNRLESLYIKRFKPKYNILGVNDKLERNLKNQVINTLS